MFKVRAFDTSYGVDVTWCFKTREVAEEWLQALLLDFGPECQAFIEEVE